MSETPIFAGASGSKGNSSKSNVLAGGGQFVEWISDVAPVATIFDALPTLSFLAQTDTPVTTNTLVASLAWLGLVLHLIAAVLVGRRLTVATVIPALNLFVGFLVRTPLSDSPVAEV